MTISIWRYSHLALAISSSLLLILASVTGIILAFEPVTKKVQPYYAETFSQTTLSQAIPELKKKYPGITELSVDANHFVLAKGSGADGKDLAYIDPQSGKILGTPAKESEFFLWVTALHRSLFLHEAGRFFVGLTAFLLILITISGSVLVIQRQRGVKRFFTRIVREDFAPYYHVVLGRWSLIPILIIALSGTYLSLARFNLVTTTLTPVDVDFDAIRTDPVKNIADFEIFKNTTFSDVESLEFPFSEDAEDYYTLKLRDRELTVNQVTGDILTEVRYPTAVLITNLSLDLHTGRTSIIWALILAVASANILFFIYSGFAITLKRRSNRIKNKYTAAESKFIILVGSENGSTFSFAQSVHRQLLDAGEKSFITELNSYNTFQRAEYLIVMTATYGLGDPPTNSKRFAEILGKYPQQSLKYSVVGFGSHSYPDFCKFAFEANSLLSRQKWAVALTDIHTVDDKSPADFGLWAEAWSQQAGIQLNISELKIPGNKKLESFAVTGISRAKDSDSSFTINLEGRPGLNVTSGDLLAIYPANDHRERLYSIGMIKKDIRLSVRLYEGGLGSGFLNSVNTGDKINARIVKNEHFHFPANASEVIMISNGTGIAPFLGMISQNNGKIPCALYCGFRGQSSYQLYDDFLKESIDSGKLKKVRTAFSRERDKHYVSDLISLDGESIAGTLAAGGVIMICGSLAMQKDVLELLESICREKNNQALSFYQSHNKIRTDCY